jgi:hypothetical protein
LEKAVNLSPGSADAWINLGSLETALENYAAGLQHFEKRSGDSSRFNLRAAERRPPTVSWGIHRRSQVPMSVP